MGGIIERQRKIYPRNNQSTISTINQWNPTLEELYGYYNRDDGYIKAVITPRVPTSPAIPPTISSM